MTIVDLIGFIISFIAIIFLFFRNRYERLHPKENLYELEQAEQELERNEPLNDFLRILEGEREERVKRPLPQDIPLQLNRKVKMKGQQTLEPRKIQSRLEYHEMRNPLEKRPKRKQEEKEKSMDPKIAQIYRKLKKPIDMVVYSEIMNKPKGW